MDQEELRKIVKEELYKIIFQERTFEKPLTTYMKSLLYDEIKYLKMKEAGFCRKCQNDTIYYFNDLEIKNLGFEIKDNIDLKAIYQERKKYNYFKGSYSDFEKTMLFKEPTTQLDWLQKTKNKYITYLGIFELFKEVYHINYLEISDINKNKLLVHIEKSFLKEEDAISSKYLLDSFNRMLNKARKAEN